MNSNAGPSRVLLVTGASRGIGAACALRAAEAGWDVGVNFHRDDEAAGRVAAQVRARGRRACTLRADVASEGDVEALGDEQSLVAPLRSQAGTAKTAPS